MKKLKESAGANSHLREEIIHEILLRLPVKSLIKFRAVCKSWDSLVSTSNFIQRHSLKSHNQHHKLLWINTWPETSNEICLYYDSPPFDKYTNHKFMGPLTAYNTHALLPANNRINKVSNLYVLGICNGIVCLAAPNVDGNITFILWNPCIRKIMTLPTPRSPVGNKCYVTYDIGYDSTTGDYKILRIETGVSVDIWSSGQPSSWKSLDVDYPIINGYDRRRAVFLRGAFHWLHSDCIVSFDVSSELFGEIMILPEAFRRGAFRLRRYMNSLSFSGSTDTNFPQLDFWEMKEYGKIDSITKLLTTKIETTSSQAIVQMGHRNNGEVVIRTTRMKENSEGEITEVNLLNPMTNQVIGDFEPPVPGYYFTRVEPFQESLALLDHPNAISC